MQILSHPPKQHHRVTKHITYYATKSRTLWCLLALNCVFPLDIASAFSTASENTNETLEANTPVIIGNLSGSAHFIKEGAATVTITGDSTDATITPAFTGTTSIRQGTVAIGNDKALGTNSIFISDRATLQATANISPLNAIQIESSTAAATGIIDNNSHRLTLESAISDATSNPGGVEFQGTGTTTLTQPSTYKGGTTVKGGKLTVNDIATPLGTNPSLTLESAGFITNCSTAQNFGLLTVI